MSDPVLHSPAGLFPPGVYDTEAWIYMAAVADAMDVVGYAKQRRGDHTLHTFSYVREDRLPTPEQYAEIMERAREWVRVWVHSPLSVQIDRAREFARDEARQAWMIGWSPAMKAFQGIWARYGANAIGVLVKSEPALLEWMTNIYRVFYQRPWLTPDQLYSTTDSSGVIFVPRLKYKFHKDVHPNVYAVFERLSPPAGRTCGALNRATDCLTSHLEMLVNLGSSLDRAKYDVCLCYAPDSVRLSHEERLTRLIAAGIQPESVQAATQKDYFNLNSLTHEMRPTVREVRNEATGEVQEVVVQATRIRKGLPLTVARRSIAIWGDRPAQYAGVPHNAVLCWPANLIHGFARHNGQKNDTHLSLRTRYLLRGNAKMTQRTSLGTLDQLWSLQIMSGYNVPHNEACRFKGTRVPHFAMGYMAQHVPEFISFCSFPYAVARALMLRFPETFPPDRPVMELARVLESGRQYALDAHDRYREPAMFLHRFWNLHSNPET